MRDSWQLLRGGPNYLVAPLGVFASKDFTCISLPRERERERAHPLAGPFFAAHTMYHAIIVLLPQRSKGQKGKKGTKALVDFFFLV